MATLLLLAKVTAAAVAILAGVTGVVAWCARRRQDR
jgi:hypothetical protein